MMVKRFRKYATRVALDGSVREEVNGMASFQVHQDRAVVVSLFPVPISYSQYHRSKDLRLRSTANATKQGIATNANAQPSGELGPSFPAEVKGDGFQGFLLPGGPSTIGFCHIVQPFCEYFARASSIGAVELANRDLKANQHTSPGQT